MVVRRSFSAATLTRLREMPADDALALLATHVKADPTYVPVKADSQSPLARVHRARRVRDPDHRDPSGTTRERGAAVVAPSIWRCTSSACRSSMRSST